MGRRKRSNRRGNKKHKRRSKKPAARVFQMGPLRITQQGSSIVWENLSTPEQHEEFLKNAAEMYPEICVQISKKVQECRAIVRGSKPLSLLMRAYWYFLSCYAGAGPEESKTSHEQVNSVRLLEYVQMLVTAVGTSDDATDISDEDFERLRRDTEELYNTINLIYFTCRSSYEKLQPNYDPSLDEFKVLVEMNWLNVRGNRYLSQDVPFLSEFLAPHSEILKDIFGLTSQEIVDGVAKLLFSFGHGVREAVLEMDGFRSDTLNKIEELFAANDTRDSDLRDMMDRVVRENGWEERRDRVFGRLLGTDLCDVVKITGWPKSFALQLAIEPGSDGKFDQGNCASWPTQLSQSRLIPFIAIEDHPYFFNIHGLTDSLYRTIERAIKSARPAYAEHWNSKQKNATETAAMELLSRILTSSQAYSSVHYKSEDESGGRKWCECDGLVVYDRTLFVVEAKGGAYTPKAPGPVIDAHVNSVKKLVRDAISQAKRFRNTLVADGEVEFFDEHRTPLGSVKRDDFDQVILCCVTLDHIDHLASHRRYCQLLWMKNLVRRRLLGI